MNKITTWAKEIAATIMASLAGPDSIAISITVWSTCSWKVVNKRFEANSLMLEVVSSFWCQLLSSTILNTNLFDGEVLLHHLLHLLIGDTPTPPHQLIVVIIGPPGSHKSSLHMFSTLQCIVSPSRLSPRPSVDCLRRSWGHSLLSWITICWDWKFAWQAFYLWSFSFKAALALIKTKVIDVWRFSRRGNRFPIWKNSCH